ncbi:hypothetical protein BC939DRAFT_454303 [Gamsiella multidivaricata]|uniref:uncharacterized protein n=1 Tax=Gamsiella multidivaricata TaxID=101098 RepID=UPI00221E9A98|nr:uncharacterized protein BC939DRAFT_454303 [Gamsiella multidivaricata]KAG0367026.1 Glycogen synthase kinase-3 beta [Gamsiella multidivaricata]KAI7822216.1 hypothetical protein BC939DRAFT_454303 [Gamsiella multidivaricata]
MVQSFPRGLSITAVAAKDLAKRKRFGAQDPYLAFYLQGRRKFTIVAVKGGVKPEWNQTIKYNCIQDATSREDTTLTVYCIHEKTGVKMGSSDGLIGSCEIDLKKTLFWSDTGVHDGWFQLMYDGKESGKVHLRLQLCEPSEDEDELEDAPVRLDHKNRIVKSKSERRADMKIAGYNAQVSGPSAGGTPVNSGTLSYFSGQPSSNGEGGLQRTPTGRLVRPQSMADLKERQPSIKIQEPIQYRMGSKSLEEVREMNTSSSDGDSFVAENDGDKRSISSPKQTFTLQDNEGNINQLNWLTAPFDPNWLEPTPPILRRALSAQFYYEDLNKQMTTNPQELFPRPQSQQSHVGYSNEPIYIPNGHQPFQSFGQAQQPQASNRQQRPNTGPINVSSNHLPQQYQQQPQYLPQQSQYPQQQLQQQPPSGAAPKIPMIQPQPQPQMMLNQLQHPTPPQQQWSPQPQGPATGSCQPQTAFQSPQSSRSKMDFAGNSKYMSLPSRNQFTPQQIQHLRSLGEGLSQPGVNHPSSMVINMPHSSLPPPQQQQQPGPTTQGFVPPVTALGPAVGYMPDTYTQEHQRVLVNQLPPAAPPVPPHPVLGPGQHNNVGYNIVQGSRSELERPGTSNSFYSQLPTQQPSATVMNQGPTQPMYFASPVPQQQQYGQNQQHRQQQQQQHSHLQPQPQPQTSMPQQQSANSYHNHNPGTSTFSTIEAFDTMQKSPALTSMAQIPLKARDAIICQYTPRAVTWDGKDIQDSLLDQSIGRRILSRYALGMAREKYVREGFYTKEKSPFMSDGLTPQQRQLQQQQRQQRPDSQRQLQRQFTMEQEGNDRVIIKYLKTKREWEIDCVMMRYLTCPHPEEKLESQYLDYPQAQQHSQTVSPFVVGLYETFMHPHGIDLDGCRYLSVLQWFPETLQGYIGDSIASGEGLEVTLPIVRSLVECVAWIHQRKVCHLNIKPSNFVRDPYMASSINSQRGAGWKLVDFEAARVIDEEIVGRCTFSYAAPEILMGNSTGQGVYAKGSLDIWSLGLVVYELLTDQPLFRTDEHARDVLMRNDNASRTIQPVRYYNSKNIDQEYHPLLDAMLAHDPERRLSASQLLKMDLFTRPISPRPVPQNQMIRNNNILSLRDLKATRLCNLMSGEQRNEINSRGSGDSAYGASLSSSQHQMLLLEGVGRILDSPFDHIPRLFMLVPPMHQDLDPAQPFRPTNLFQNKSLRLVLLCEGLSGYGEDAHVTDHRGYVIQDPVAFVQDVGKLLLHLVAVAGTNNPGYETPALDRPLTLTGTPLDNCQRWYPSLRSYYEALQGAIQQQVGPAPSLNELRSLRGPTLKMLEQWLVRLVRRQCQAVSMESLKHKPSVVTQSDLLGHARLPAGPGGSGGYDDLSDQFAGASLQDTGLPEVTGPGGGEGYGGLYKMPVGTCGDRWICRGCVSKQMAMMGSTVP